MTYTPFTLTIESPNVAAVAKLKSGTVYIYPTQQTRVINNELLETVSYHTTIPGAFQAAQALDSNYSLESFFGKDNLMHLGGANISNTVTEANLGDSVTINSESTLAFSSLSTVFLTPTYQWYRNDMEIPGATSSTLSTSSLAEGQLGDYICKMTVTSSVLNYTDSFEIVYTIKLPDPTPVLDSSTSFGM